MKKVISLIVALAMILVVMPVASFAEVTDADIVFSASFDEDVSAEVGKITVNGSGFTVTDGIHGKAVHIPIGAGNYLTLTDADGGNNLLVGKDAVTITFFENREDGRWPLFAAPNNAPQTYLSENYLGLYDNDAFRVERYLGGRNNPTSSQVLGEVVSGWKHIAIVLTDAYTELFVNGISVAKTDSTSKISDLFPTTSYVQIGRGNWGDGEDFVGLIDEFKVFNRVLTNEEIAKEAVLDTSVDEVIANLNVPAETEKDLALTTFYMGADITWTSSDESVITNEGKITRYAEDKKVKLTAHITTDAGKTGDKEFDVTVKAIPLADIEAAVKINDTDNILDSITLAEKVGGVDITWTSTNPDVVTDKSMPNPDSPGYTIPAGYVTRTDKDEKVTLTYEYNYGGEVKTGSYELTVKAKKPEEEKVAYLYAYFRGNVNGEAERLSIHFATSEDGYNWTDLNGNFPVVESTMGTKSLRDPYILRSRYGDKFYLVATDLNTQDGGGWGKWSLDGSKYLMIWSSEDLVNWGEQRMVKFANDDIGCAWAPESVYDVDTGEYLVYASGKDLSLYRESGQQVDTVYVTRTRDFYSFSEPEIFVAPVENGERKNAIDSTIIRGDDGKYYHFYKKYNSQVWMMVSDHAGGPYEEVTAFTPIGGEGPAIYKVNGTEQYALCIDDYSKYVPYLTNDIASGQFTKSTKEVTMPTGSKHGGMIPISQTEYDALLKAYGPKDVDPDAAGPILEYDFEDESATEGLLKGNATIAEDAEHGSKVLSLDGVKENASYFQFPEGTFDRRDTFTLLMDVKSAMTGNFFDFALGQEDGSDHYMYFRARQGELCLSETVFGWEHERRAITSQAGIDGQWARIALVVKPGYLAVYKDGKMVAENTDARVGEAGDMQGGKFTTSHLGVNGLVAYLGKSLFENDEYVNGSFDNVALYNRALTPAEIALDNDPDASVEDMLNSDMENVTLPAEVREDLELPTSGAYGTNITWASSDPAITAEGKVTRPALNEEDKLVTLTAEFNLSGIKQTKEYTVTVKAGGPLWHSTADWTKHEFTPVEGNVVLTMEFIPTALADSTIAIGPAGLDLNNWGQYNIGFHTTAEGKFEAHNGEKFTCDNEFTVEVGKSYLITVTADTNAQTYSLAVCAADDPEKKTTVIAESYPFRNKTEGPLSWANVRGGNGVAADLFMVDNFRSYGVNVEPGLRIFDEADAASFGLAFDIEVTAEKDALTDLQFVCGAAQVTDKNYVDTTSEAYYSKAKTIDNVPLAEDGKYRVTITGISKNNSARSYVVDVNLGLPTAPEKLTLVRCDGSLYDALAKSIVTAKGAEIPEPRLRTANEIISFVEQNRTRIGAEVAEAKFPGLSAARSGLYNEDGTLTDKAAKLGISGEATVQFAEALSIETVELEFVSTDMTESESSDITAAPDFIPEL